MQYIYDTNWLGQSKERKMVSKWILNIRCTCEEELSELRRLHNLYRAEKKAQRIERYAAKKKSK